MKKILLSLSLLSILFLSGINPVNPLLDGNDVAIGGTVPPPWNGIESIPVYTNIENDIAIGGTVPEPWGGVKSLPIDNLAIGGTVPPPWNGTKSIPLDPNENLA